MEMKEEFREERKKGGEREFLSIEESFFSLL